MDNYPTQRYREEYCRNCAIHADCLEKIPTLIEANQEIILCKLNNYFVKELK